MPPLCLTHHKLWWDEDNQRDSQFAGAKMNEPFANAGEQRNFQFWLTDLPVLYGPRSGPRRKPQELRCSLEFAKGSIYVLTHDLGVFAINIGDTQNIFFLDFQPIKDYLPEQSEIFEVYDMLNPSVPTKPLHYLTYEDLVNWKYLSLILGWLGSGALAQML